MTNFFTSMFGGGKKTRRGYQSFFSPGKVGRIHRGGSKTKKGKRMKGGDSLLTNLLVPVAFLGTRKLLSNKKKSLSKKKSLRRLKKK